MMTLGCRIDGELVKYLCDPVRAPAGGSAYPAERTVETPTSIDIDRIFTGFHNVLLEVQDEKNVCFFVTNYAPAVRYVCVQIWGWVDNVTRVSEAVFH
jgi:hypothetical protein